MNKLIKLFLVHIILLSRCIPSFAQENAQCELSKTLKSSGDWSAVTVNSNTSPDTTEPILQLTGHINLKGTITISSGYTLRIIHSADKNDPLTIKFTKNSGTMFTVQNGGKLIIEGNDFTEGTSEGNNGGNENENESGKIILDGGANFTWDETSYELTSTKSSLGNICIISSAGALELNNTIIQNSYYSSRYTGALKITSKTGQTLIQNSIIRLCKGRTGSAIMIEAKYTVEEKNNGTNYDSDNCSISLVDCIVEKCVTGGGTQDNNGGAIRTLGDCIPNLYLTGTTFRYNHAIRTDNGSYNNTLAKDANGGALFWNARGNTDTKCVINGCHFHHNRSQDNGGAIKSQASIEFTEGKTIFEYNSAPNGAALYIEGYTGGVTTGVREITLELNDKLIIQHNNANSYTFNEQPIPAKGTGVHFCFIEKDMRLTKGSKISIDLKGAQIVYNETDESGVGGGIYFEKIVGNTPKYEYSINLNYGTVGNNTASKGGGIYISEGDVQSQKVLNQTLLIENNSAANGAGIYIKNGNLTIAEGRIQNNNIDQGNGAGIYIEYGDFTINDGSIKNNIVNNGNGGGVYILGKKEKDKIIGNFTMNGGSITMNKAEGDYEGYGFGGGIYVNGGNFTLTTEATEGKISLNTSTKDGGGVYISGGQFEQYAGEISQNTSNRDGGGVYLNGGNFVLTNQGVISNNIALQNGGGVFLTGDNCIYELQNGILKENTASNGGGVYLDNGTFILGNEEDAQKGEISSNTANYGGGVYIGPASSNAPSAQNNGNNTSTIGFKMIGGTIKENIAISEDKEERSGGGVYLNGGSLNISNGTISDNETSGNGGGVFIMNGNVEMSGGRIEKNTSHGYGGGVYVYNSEESQTSVNFGLDENEESNESVRSGENTQSGVIAENSAEFGGGVCVDGNIKLTVNQVHILSNEATNGGGICLMNGALMKFNAGQIKFNNAICEDDDYNLPTAHLRSINNVKGIGGGVYLDSGTTLEFAENESLGLFGNTADIGADELFANGNGTTVNLPDVSDMTFENTTGVGNLAWIEDYITNDDDYMAGTNLLEYSEGSTNTTNLRYRDMLSQNMQEFPQLDDGITATNTYICFALGYKVIYITLTRQGLKNGESAIYRVRKNITEGEREVDFRVILTGSNQNSVSKRIAVTAGTWEITETGWSWDYENLQNNTISQDVTDADKPEFLFSLKQDETLTPNDEPHLRHEDIVVVEMGGSSSHVN